MSYAIYEKEYITNNNVSTDEFYESMAKVYSFLKTQKTNGIKLRDEYGIGYETLFISMLNVTEECLDCNCVYFHNYCDVGIEEGRGEIDGWKCAECLKKYEENKLFAFECERKERRELKKTESQIPETNEEEICCICLDELKICGIDSGDYDENEKNVSLNPCGHTLCAKCNFDLKNSNEDIICPLCRTQII
jgi:hypothetical protein